MLGWTEERWAEDETPPMFEMHWFDLDDNVRRAAVHIGYSRDTWSDCQEAPCLERFNYVKRKFEGVKWADMSPATQLAMKMLGYSAGLWDAGQNSETLQMQWQELAHEQQTAAMFLGHTRDTWQGCANWQDPITTIPPNTERPKDPMRAVRGRMLIDRSFTEISGHLQGSFAEEHSASPSFVVVFERAVARAVFCRNPWVEDDGTAYTDNDGKPKCVRRDLMEQQMDRIKVIRVVKGSIIVDFMIYANRTADEPLATDSLLDLGRQLQNRRSPASRDIEFGRFAVVAELEEVDIPPDEAKKHQEVLAFEGTRGMYNNENACQLQSDKKHGINACPSSSLRQRPLALAALAALILPLLLPVL